jgi:hypothetical protein
MRAAAAAVADDAAAAAMGMTEALAADAQAVASDAMDAASALAETAANAAAELGRAVAAPGGAAAAAAAAPFSVYPQQMQRVIAPAQPGSGSSGGSKPASPASIEKLKVRLLAAVASLDRGLAANVREASEVDALSSRLEAAGGGDVALSWTTTEARPDTSSMEMMDGTWRLIYRLVGGGGGVGGGTGGGSLSNCLLHAQPTEILCHLILRLNSPPPALKKTPQLRLQHRQPGRPPPWSPGRFRSAGSWPDLPGHRHQGGGWIRRGVDRRGV